MEICNVIKARYESSHTKTTSDVKVAEFYSYMDYKVNHNSSYNYWILTFPTEVLVTVSSSFGTKTIDMNKLIVEYYDRKKISKKLYKTFCNDLINYKIDIYVDKNGEYHIL